MSGHNYHAGVTLPEGTTWLDLFTLVVAGAGLFIALGDLWLTFLRDRETGLVKVRLEVSHQSSGKPWRSYLVLRVANIGRRTVTIERAGFSVRSVRSKEFDNVRRRTVAIDSDAVLLWSVGGKSFAPFRKINESFPEGSERRNNPALPSTIEPGGPVLSLYAPADELKRQFADMPPAWTWAEDSYGTMYWAQVPRRAQSRIWPDVFSQWS